MQIEKTVFISYRRANSFHARAIFQALYMHGYDVFYDIESINAGSFEQIILNQIKARAHFVLVLTPTALERCINPGDWVRREIETAIEYKRNIIPLLFDGFQFDVTEKYLVGKLNLLPGYNGVRIYTDYFNEGMERLRTRFLHVPLDLVLHPVSSAEQKVVSERIVEAASQPIVTPEQLRNTSKIQIPISISPEFNLYEAIKQFASAVDAKKWKSAYSILTDIRESGVEIPRTFNIDSHEQDVVKEIQAEDRDREYNVVRQLAKVKNPNTARIWEALRVFWKSYPNYDPDHLERFILPEPPGREYFRRAQEYHKKGDYDRAIADYTEAIRLDARFAYAYNSRGYTYHHGKQAYDLAIADYSEAIRLDPQYSVAYYNRGYSYHHGKQAYDLAIADYSEAIRLDPQYSVAYYNRGNSYYCKKDYDRAIADLSQTIHLNPKHAIAYNNRGNSYYCKKDYDRAIADYETALRINPNNVFAAQSLKISEEMLKKQKE